MTSRYATLAAYNAWANQRIYAAAETLSEADYRADRGAFFKSVHGTLNHLLVADRIWTKRFTGEGEHPNRLDAILHEDLAALRAARAAEDARIARWIGGLSAEDLAGVIRYRTITNPRTVEQELAPALDHFFNHQTHHRGQVHALLTAIAGEAPSLDLILLQRESGTGIRLLD
ncbi:MAG: DinB family protein [Xanthobacteraceae bacterium]|nr:DinB family protein [Xanthobacteraceae bacterium]